MSGHVPETAHDLRCFCSRRPKLAVYGRDSRGNAYLHVRTFKQHRIFGEVVITSGEVHLRCRECLRWTVIHIRKAQVDVSRDAEAPAVVASPE